MTIKCLLHYAPGEESRFRFPAAEAKTEYLLSCLRRLGYDVQILSACRTEEGLSSSGRVKSIARGITLELLPCLGGAGWGRRKLSTLLFYAHLTHRLLSFVKDGDTLWAYHSLPLMLPLKILKRMRKVRLILEVEELYADVVNKNWIRRRELDIVSLADALLVPARELERIVNPGKKPCVICHGPYSYEEPGKRQQDGKLHVVYAGSADPRKGAFLAAEAARFLPENCHVHILGEKTPEIADALARTQPQCTLTHHGLLREKACRDFLKTCHVGLCSQDWDAAFNETSFPSKILTYLSCGLQVVCPPIPAVKASGVGDLPHYYFAPVPEAVAAAILEAAGQEDDRGSRRIRELDREFLPKLKELLEADG